MLFQQSGELPVPPVHHAPLPQGLLVGQILSECLGPDPRRPRDLQFLGEERVGAPMGQEGLHAVVLGLADFAFDAVDDVGIPRDAC